MAQIAYRTNRGHTRTTLEGVQVTLQRRQRHGVVRLAQPALQRLPRAFQNVDGFFEEDLDHLLVELGIGRAEARVRFRHWLGLDGLERLPGQLRLAGLLARGRLFGLLEFGSGLVQLDDLQTFDIGRQQRQGVRVDGFGQQLTQRLNTLGLRADLQRGGHLVHHADQRFVGFLCLVEETLADGQAAFLDGAIEVEQGFAELVDLRQFGHFRATSQGRQLFQQRGQLLALGGVLAPLAQQVLGIQQDVHAFGEENADQLRITALAAFSAALVLGTGEAILMQCLDPGKECLGTGNRCQWLAFQVVQADAEQPLGTAQQFRSGEVDLNQVGLEFLDQLLQRRGDFRHGENAGHVGTALERVQGALQVVGYRLRQLLRTIGEEADQGIQMSLGLVAEDLQQLRVEGLAIEVLIHDDRGLLDGGGSFGYAHGFGYLRSGRGVRFWGRLPLGQGVRRGGQQVDIIALTLGLGGELLDQCRHQGDDIEHDLLHRCSGLDAAIQNTVEQVLDGPGQLPDDQRAHHAPAALEGVEGAPHFDQRILVVGIGLPLRQVLGDGFQHFAGFFDEDFQQLLVHRLLVGRRRQQAGRNVGCRRVDRLYRCGHHIGHRQRLVRLRLGGWRRNLGRAGQFDFRQFQVGQFQLVPLRRLAQLLEAQLFQLRFRLDLDQRGRGKLVVLQRRQLIELRQFEGEAVSGISGDRQLRVALQQFQIGRCLGGLLVDLVDLGRDLGQRLFQQFVLGAEQFDFLQRVGQWRQGFFLRLDTVENRRLFLEGIAQGLQAFLGNVEDQIALGAMVFGQTLEVVLNAGDGVGQGIQALPVGHGLACQQLLLNVAVAGIEQVGGTLQRNHRQATTDLGQQLGHARQVFVVPLRGNELDDRVLGLLQAIARFLDDELVNLPDIGGRQVALLVLAVIARADHAGQRRFDVEQRSSHVHQHRVVRFALAEGQRMDHVDLVENDLARLAETKHREGIGDLLQRGQQGIQLARTAAVATHEQIEAVLDPHQLLAQCRHHRAHGIAVGASQAGTLFVHHLGIGQGIVEAVLRLQATDARRLRRRLGHIEQQVLGQFVGSGLVDAVSTFFDQALELLVDLAQQGAHRGAVDHAAIGQPFDQAGGDLPQAAQRGVLAQVLQTGENPRHVAEVGGQVLVADDADQRHLQHLPQLAQQHRQFGGTQTRQATLRQRRQADGHVRGEQAGFRQQLLATGGAQVVEQWQHDHRQVATGGLDAVEVDRQLQDRLHQHFQGLALVGDAAFHQCLGQLFHLFGEQRSAVELDHLQGAVNLVHVGQAEAHARGVLRVLDERLQGLPRLLQGFPDLAFYPLQGDIIMPITHSHSTHKLGLIPCG